jgi:hypothetical protein
MLPVSLDSLLLTFPSVCYPEIQATLGTQHKIQTTIKAKEPQSKQKGKSIIENPEIQATLGTQYTEGRQSKQRNNTANRRESQ